MIPSHIKRNIKKDDLIIAKNSKSSFNQPQFDSRKYYKQISHSNYYYALIVLRHYIKLISDFYFSSIVKAKNVDLFMMTNSVSSPTGSGSDSEIINIKFGKMNTCLVDSSQFGFEPLLSENLKALYCYLPSMRGEDPDNRHLNQFFHCEAEIIGTLDDIIPIIENYIKILSEMILEMPQTIERLSGEPAKTKLVLRDVINSRNFYKITLDNAIKLLRKNNKIKKSLKLTKHGKCLTSEGEIELLKILKVKTPVWLTYFDRNTVPFYQKPFPNDKEKVINADLLFSPITKNSFGGEIVGSGQRQDNPEEIYESLRRQKIKSKDYEWYIDIRRNKKYKITSGFGLGIERFIAWSIGKKNIRDVALYPRIKNVKMYP